MGVTYSLVNHSRGEFVLYAHIPAGKKRELVGNAVSAAITTWYLLEHREDRVAFVSDDVGDWPFPTGSQDDLAKYQEVTDRVVRELVAAEILKDYGVLWSDPDEPDRIFERDLRVTWRSDEEPAP